MLIITKTKIHSYLPILENKNISDICRYLLFECFCQFILNYLKTSCPITLEIALFFKEEHFNSLMLTKTVMICCFCCVMVKNTYRNKTIIDMIYHEYKFNCSSKILNSPYNEN